MFLDSGNAANLTFALQNRYEFKVSVSTDVNQALEQSGAGRWDIILFSSTGQTEEETAATAILAQTFDAPIIVLANGPPPAALPAKVTRLPQNTSVDKLATVMAGLATAPASLSPLTRRATLLEAHNSLLDRVKELDALLEIGKTVTSIFDVDAILRKVVGAAVNLTKAEEGYLLLIDQSTGALYLRAEQNLGEAQARDFQIKTTDSIAGQVIQTGRPILLTQDRADIKVKTGYTVYALINVPLVFGDRVIGVLGANQRTQKSFNDNDLRVMQALADWAAIAITNARLYREAQRGSKSIELINEISGSILSSLHMAEIPHKLIKNTTEIVGAECGSLALVDNQTRELVFQLAYDRHGQEIKAMHNLRLPLGRGIIGAVAADGQPRIVNQVRGSKLWYSKLDSLLGFTTEEILAVPLKTEGRIIGVVELLNKRDSHFDSNDQDLLMAVASAAAIAIQNARQFEALEQAHRDLRAAQQQRIATEQWSILGRATANLAHRIHNTTTIVPLAVQDLREQLQQVGIPAAAKPDVEANLDRIERNVTYTIDLANNLLRRFHQEPVAAYDVNKIIGKALALLQIPPRINLAQALAKDMPPVDSSSLLGDAIVELCSNAIKAMPQEGTLTVRSFYQEGMIYIQVSDTGVGISPERQQKIFNLFYSDTVSGLGFGLWWVRTFLQQYGGDIEVESQLGNGATFTMRLPSSRKKIDLTPNLE